MPTALRLAVLTVVTVVICGCSGTPARDEWPTQAVRLVVPFGTGSGVDLAARLFASRLAERWHHPVVVDNRPGADGVIGTQAFVASKDRHALFFAPPGSLTFAPHLHEQLPYDPVGDLVPISSVGSVTIAIAVATPVKASSLSELATLVREHPGRYLWASGSPGGPELALKAFIAQEHLEMKQVRYRETSIALQDVGAARVHVILGSLPTISPLVQAGSVRLLAVTNTSRSAAALDVPTVSESGFPALTLDGLWGVFGGRDMTDTRRRRIAADLAHVAQDRELTNRLTAVGLAVHAGTPEEFGAAVERQRQQAATLARLSGLSRE